MKYATLVLCLPILIVGCMPKTAEIKDPAPEEKTAVSIGCSNCAQPQKELILFAYDSAIIQDSEKQKLTKGSALLKAKPEATLVIEGHTDERGTREYNLALGFRRAAAVKNALVALGIDGRRIEIISYGKERPVLVGSTEAAWAGNRRAEINPE